MEGSFEGQKNNWATTGVRAAIVKHEDNLKIEGDFTGRQTQHTGSVGQRVATKKYSDNLQLEGKIEMHKREWATKGERAAITREQDHLQKFGGIEGRRQEVGAIRGERMETRKLQDNLKMEGEFLGKSAEKSTYLKGERMAVVKHSDNLKIEGKMEQRKTENTHMAVAEKVGEIKRTGAVRVEGEVEGRKTETSSSSHKQEMISSVQRKQQKRQEQSSNIVIGETAAISSNSTAAISSSSTAAAAVSSSATSAISRSKTSATAGISKETAGISKETLVSSKGVVSNKVNQSTAVASAIVQSKSESASITAVNTDKFASSLRESSAVQIGVQKDMSVIDNHRKQSLHHQGSRRQTQQGYDHRASYYEDVGGWGQHYSADNRQQYSAAKQQQQQQYSTKQEYSSSGRQEYSSSSRYSTATAMDSRQEYSLGYSSREQDRSSSSWQQKRDNVSRTTLNAERSQSGRRKTWAESSIYHGETSGYAIGHSHDSLNHQCPAAQVYTRESPYKYSRQNSSGHKVFTPHSHSHNIY